MSEVWGSNPDGEKEICLSIYRHYEHYKTAIQSERTVSQGLGLFCHVSMARRLCSLPSSPSAPPSPSPFLLPTI